MDQNGEYKSRDTPTEGLKQQKSDKDRHAGRLVHRNDSRSQPRKPEETGGLSDPPEVARPRER